MPGGSVRLLSVMTSRLMADGSGGQADQTGTSLSGSLN
jgi:hypothetical protein